MAVSASCAPPRAPPPTLYSIAAPAAPTMSKMSTPPASPGPSSALPPLPPAAPPPPPPPLPAAALLVVDMQADFCMPSGALCVKGAMGCLARVVDAVEEARAAGMKIIWVVREHEPDGSDVELFRAPLFAGGGKGAAVRGTPGAALVRPLEVRAGEVKLVKTRFSAFMGTPLASILRRAGVGRVAVCGVQTPNCIRATAMDAMALDFPEVAVLADATASASEEVQAANLADLRAVGIVTPTYAEWTAARRAARRALLPGGGASGRASSPAPSSRMGTFGSRGSSPARTRGSSPAPSLRGAPSGGSSGAPSPR